MTPKRPWRADWLWPAAALVVILLGLWWFPGRAGIPTDSYSTAPRGRKAFYTLVAELVRDTRRSERDLLPPGKGARTLVMIGPTRYPKPGEWRMLHEWVSEGNSLLFAARLEKPLVDLGPFGMRVKGILPRAAPAKTPAAAPGHAHAVSVRTSLVQGEVRWLSRGAVDVDDAEGVFVVESDRGAQAVVARVGQGKIVVVASDEIFVNRSLLSDRAGLLAWRLLEQCSDQGGGTVRFDEHLNRTGTPRTIGLLFDPFIRPITLQLLLCAVLFGWWGFRRFGPARPALDQPRRSMVEHAEALGNLHYRAGTGDHALGAYLDYWRGEYLSPGGGRVADQIQRLARQARRDPAEVTRLLREAESLARGQGGESAQTPEHAPRAKAKVSAPRVTHIIRELARLGRALRETRGRHGNQ